MNKKHLHNVKQYYDQKIKQFGATSQGVDWNGKASHVLRFEQLTKVLPKSDFTILDFGCGFGSLVGYLQDNNFIDYKYYGYDISEEMLQNAKAIHNDSNIVFTNNLNTISEVDYVVANGVFNVKLDELVTNWEVYVRDTIVKMNNLAVKGLSFNLLTSYSDEEFMQQKLYYANPADYFDWCKTEFSRNVALLHDYDLYEFTLIIKKAHHG